MMECVPLDSSKLNRCEIARGAAVTRTAVQTVNPRADNSVRETMNLTSSLIDDTKEVRSGPLEKKVELISKCGKVLVVANGRPIRRFGGRSEEHTSELQSRFGISYAVFCLKKK